MFDFALRFMGWGWSSQLFQWLVLFLWLISVSKSHASTSQMAERSSGGRGYQGRHCGQVVVPKLLLCSLGRAFAMSQDELCELNQLHRLAGMLGCRHLAPRVVAVPRPQLCVTWTQGTPHYPQLASKTLLFGEMPQTQLSETFSSSF